MAGEPEAETPASSVTGKFQRARVAANDPAARRCSLGHRALAGRPPIGSCPACSPLAAESWWNPALCWLRRVFARLRVAWAAAAPPPAVRHAATGRQSTPRAWQNRRSSPRRGSHQLQPWAIELARSDTARFVSPLLPAAPVPPRPPPAAHGRCSQGAAARAAPARSGMQKRRRAPGTAAMTSPPGNRNFVVVTRCDTRHLWHERSAEPRFAAGLLVAN